MSKVGLLLGAGPSVSSYFYYKLNELSRVRYGSQPELFMYNLHFSSDVENTFIAEQEKSKMYETSLRNAVDFFSMNKIKQIAFPCFSLSPMLDKICVENSIELINPFINTLVKSNDAIISVTDIRDMFKLKSINTIEFHNIDVNSVGLDKSIIEIVNGANPMRYCTQLEKIELDLINQGIKRLIIACTELCLIEYDNKIQKVNLLDVLIEMTLNAISKNNFG